jgi:hypothetical protein
MSLCLRSHIIAEADDSYDDKIEELQKGKLVERMGAYLNFVSGVLSQYEKGWSEAINNQWDFQMRLSLLNSIATGELGGVINIELGTFKEKVKAVESEERREILIEMYTILERLSEQVRQPTGSLRDFQENVSEKVEEYRNLKTKLEFAE